MLRLNMRVTQAMIGMNTQLGKLDAHSTPAELHTQNKEARSTAHWTQPSVEIDQYPSRHAYGYSNNTDFAKEHGEQGFSDLAKTTSDITQQAWANIENGGKRGKNPPLEAYKNRLWQDIKKQRYIKTELIPDPTIKYTPVKAEGVIEPSDISVSIDADSFAKTNFNRGKVETYIKQKADVRRWVSEGKYDIYA